MRKRLASIALALTLSIGMMPTTAWAEDDGISVQNIQGIAEKETMFSANWIVGTENNGDAKKVQRDITDNYFITADKTEWNARNFCYLVKDNVTINGDVTVGDSVSLCLCDNATLTINGSVKINRSRGQLDIMGQSTGDNAGRMIVNNPDGNAFECLDSTSGTADIFMYSGRLTATGKDRALGENVYLYKAENSSSNSTPILCVADGQKVRATASKTNPDEPHWSSNKGQSAFSAKSFTLQWCNHENEEWGSMSKSMTKIIIKSVSGVTGMMVGQQVRKRTIRKQNRRLTARDIAESVYAAMAVVRWKHIRGVQII